MASAQQQHGRLLGPTEQNWELAVGGGTGITVMAAHFDPSPSTAAIQSSLESLQKHHPRLGSLLALNERRQLAFHVAPEPYAKLEAVQVQTDGADVASETEDETSGKPVVVKIGGPVEDTGNSKEHAGAWDSVLKELVEREMNRDFGRVAGADQQLELFSATLYRLQESSSVLILRVHTAACDRASAATVLSELFAELARRSDDVSGQVAEFEGNLESVEDVIPKELKEKPFWQRGLDVVGYAAVSRRHAYLPFDKPAENRCSQVLLRALSAEETARLRDACAKRDLKLHAAICAAGLKATAACKSLGTEHAEHFGLTTLLDCRKLLEGRLPAGTVGFYHSAMMNTVIVSEGDDFWDVAKRVGEAVSQAVKNRKQFTDMGDLNLLMHQAIMHPGLTPSGSLRTSLLSVFLDPGELPAPSPLLGVKSTAICASVHGVGPCVGVFDTIYDGKELHLALVYPSPLLSAELMNRLADDMLKFLADSMSAPEGGEGE